MEVTVLFFGEAAERSTSSQLQVAGIKTMFELKEYLDITYVGLKKCNYSLALNKVITSTDEKLKDQDVVAILPPFSGG